MEKTKQMNLAGINAESEKSFYFSDLLLIQEVEKYPALWDQRAKGYRNENKKAALFSAIADKLGKDVEEVEFRWHSLRRSYVRKKKAALEKRVDGAAVVSWPLYKYLSFLGPAVRNRKFVTKTPVILRCKPEESLHNSSSGAHVIVPVCQVQDMSDNEDRCWNSIENIEELAKQGFPESNQDSMSLSSVESKRRDVDITDETVIHDINGETNKYTNKSDSDIDKLDKDNLDFFKSLLPMCRNFTNVQKLNFRLEVMNTIRRFMESQ